MSKARKLIDLLEADDPRIQAADQAFADYDFEGEDVAVSDSGNWEKNGPDSLAMTFAYDYEGKTEHGSFVVEFEKGTDKVTDAHPNYN